MGLLSRFFPKEPNFFAIFADLSEKAINCAERLALLTQDPVKNIRMVEEIARLEDEADGIVHHGLVQLHETFITPLDRINIYQLLLKMDEVIDIMHAAAQRVKLMEISQFNADTVVLARTTADTVKLMKTLVVSLEKMKTPEEIQRICIEINRYENKADDELRAGLADILKKSADFREFYKYKEYIELLEEVTDKVEDTTHLVEAIILDHA